MNLFYFSGNTCLDSVDICQGATNPCNPGHSKCIDLYRGYFCECDQGYFGVNCTERSNLLCESFPCQHGGTCTETSSTSFSCQCPEGYDGLTCASVVDNCLGNPCQNGGACISYNQGYKCSCPYGFRGDRCETPYDRCTVANPCQNPGSTCRDVRGVVTCSCGAGYSGPYCQTKDVECSASSCENGATCTEVGSAISCSCPTGFEGSRCETNIDDCANTNCPSGSRCVDGLNTFTCVCLEDRVGEDCSKVVSPTFDVILSGTTSYQTSDYQRLVQPINQRAFTASTWVRFTKRDTPGTVLSLYGLRSATDFSDPEEILRLDREQVQLSFGTPRTLGYSPPVDDGYWHHIAVSWDSNQGAVNLYVDGQLANVAGSYHTLQSVRPFGWLVLGGTYDSASKSVDQSGGMTGRLSHTYISSKALSQSEVSTLASDRTAVPADPISGFTVAMATGATAATDYDSELAGGVCLSSSGCKSLDAITAANPQFTSCPGDQVRVSDRVSTPAWDVPTVSGGVTGSATTGLRTTQLSGQTTMGWGVHGVTYANMDSDGNADVCSFRLFNRSKTCHQSVVKGVV
ncbi:EGF-domain, multiple [Elysia marginata]|uniref:EGF-domain, multiple n=1 Tax=Elysia marginata TaxID=1093978 RepID=A0AAV4HUN2_9GAST|nr:EGF-domain, multiple [Elysia marginata]